MKMLGAKKVRWKFDDVGSTPSGRLSTAWQSLSQIELQALIGMLVRQWRLIVSITGLLLILAAAILSLLSYRYTAETLLAVDERGSELVGQADPIGSGVTFNNRVDSEVEILNSSSVALGVIDNLALWRDPEFGIDGLSLSEKLKSLIGISPTQKIEHNYVRLSDIPGAQQTQLVDRLQAAIKIGRHGLTSLISIKATSKDSEKAAFIANSVADSYLNVQITAKDKTAQSAVAFLAQRVEELAKDIQLLNARTESFIVDQANALGTPETKTEMLRIKNEINNLASDQADFSARLTRLQSLQFNPASMSLDTIPAELRAIAEERDNAAKAALAEVTDSNVQAQLKELDQKLRDAAQQQSENVRRQLANTDKLKDDLRKQLQEIFIHQSIPNEVSVNLFRLQSESENTRKLYESFSNRLAAVKQQLGFTLPNSRVVAPATIPFRPSYPPTTLLMIGALMLGLVSGVMAAIARENLVGGFILPAQLEAVTGLPVIAAVPLSHSKMPANILLEDPLSPFSETLRRLRLGIEDLVASDRHSVVAVTSTEPGEGKSTIALCLGRTLAAAGRRTLLIDCDLRHPSVGKLAGVESPSGLADMLQTEAKLMTMKENIVKDAGSGLELITTSVSMNRASDLLLNSVAFRRFLEEIVPTYEFVLLDTPPIGYVVDARILAKESDFLIFVVKQNSTSQQDVVGGLRQLVQPDSGGRIGLVLNSVRTSLGGYYGNNRYAYYYGKK